MRPGLPISPRNCPCPWARASLVSGMPPPVRATLSLHLSVKRTGHMFAIDCRGLPPRTALSQTLKILTATSRHQGKDMGRGGAASHPAWSGCSRRTRLGAAGAAARCPSPALPARTPTTSTSMSGAAGEVTAAHNPACCTRKQPSVAKSKDQVRPFGIWASQAGACLPFGT